MMDLSLVSIDDMLDELDRRCKSFISAYQTFSDSDKEVIMTRYGNGKWFDATRLSNILNNDCLNNWNGELQTLQRINGDGD